MRLLVYLDAPGVVEKTLGLLFGLFKDRSGTLGAPIVLHVFYNSGYFWLFGQVLPGQ